MQQALRPQPDREEWRSARRFGRESIDQIGSLFTRTQRRQHAGFGKTPTNVRPLAQALIDRLTEAEPGEPAVVQRAERLVVILEAPLVKRVAFAAERAAIGDRPRRLGEQHAFLDELPGSR